MIAFSDRLKELRKEKNLTQKALASLLSVTIPTLSHWECGYQEPSFHDVLNICRCLNCSTDYLLGRTDDLGAVLISGESFRTTPLEQQLILNYRCLPHQSQEYVYGIIQNLAANS